MVIIDGKETAMEIKQEIAKEVKRMMLLAKSNLIWLLFLWATTEVAKPM